MWLFASTHCFKTENISTPFSDNIISGWQVELFTHIRKDFVLIQFDHEMIWKYNHCTVLLISAIRLVLPLHKVNLVSLSIYLHVSIQGMSVWSNLSGPVTVREWDFVMFDFHSPIFCSYAKGTCPSIILLRAICALRDCAGVVFGAVYTSLKCGLNFATFLEEPNHLFIPNQPLPTKENMNQQWVCTKDNTKLP